MMLRQEEIIAFKSIEEALWYLLNSNNPIQQAGLSKVLKPLNEIIERLEQEVKEVTK